jgi:hypothetical protein
MRLAVCHQTISLSSREYMTGRLALQFRKSHFTGTLLTFIVVYDPIRSFSTVRQETLAAAMRAPPIQTKYWQK